MGHGSHHGYYRRGANSTCWITAFGIFIYLVLAVTGAVLYAIAIIIVFTILIAPAVNELKHKMKREYQLTEELLKEQERREEFSKIKEPTTKGRMYMMKIYAMNHVDYVLGYSWAHAKFIYSHKQKRTSNFEITDSDTGKSFNLEDFKVVIDTSEGKVTGSVKEFIDKGEITSPRIFYSNHISK